MKASRDTGRASRAVPTQSTRAHLREREAALSIVTALFFPLDIGFTTWEF